MTGNEYQKLAMRTCSINDDNKSMMYHGVFGLTSEAGEVAGLLQKVYHQHTKHITLLTELDGKQMVLCLI